MNIDFHNHFYPKAYIDELSKGGGYARVETDEHGRLLVHYEGDYNIVVGPHIDIDARLEAMDRCGVDMQLIKLARLANDGFSEVIEEHPDRFHALAALPLQAPEAAADELERAVKELGLKGGTLMTNVGGKPLDLEEFHVVYERAVKLDVPLFFHPTSPINHKWMGDWRLVPIMGFGIDTSLNVLRFVFSGLLDKMPKLKLVASHLGGVFPYLRGRIEIGFNAYPECKVNIKEPPSTYLKRIWTDSIIYDEDVLMSTLAF